MVIIEMTAADIATDLNRTITSVENYIKKTHVKMLLDSSWRSLEHHRGVMTENASTMADAKRKVSHVQEKCVTKIK